VAPDCGIACVACHQSLLADAPVTLLTREGSIASSPTLRRHAAGRLAGGHSAHPVADYIEIVIRIIAEGVFVVAAHIFDGGCSGEFKCNSEHCQAVYYAMEMQLATRLANNPPGGLLRDLDRKLPRRDEADHSAPVAHKCRDIVQSRGIAQQHV